MRALQIVFFAQLKQKKNYRSRETVTRFKGYPCGKIPPTPEKILKNKNKNYPSRETMTRFIA